MPYRFNETNIITGQIKEILKDFNLPSCAIYTKDPNRDYYPDRLYIKDHNLVRCISSNICKYTEAKFKELMTYHAGDYIRNITKNLVINSSEYDSYIHTYLGNYLRFLRDYKNLNLMPLYNCFNNETPKNLRLSISYKTSNKLFDTSDTLFEYYIVPIKLDQIYTIAIDTLAPFEVCCIVNTSGKMSDQLIELANNTYKKFNQASFRNPVIYDTYSIKTEIKNRFWPFEDHIRLLFKIPSKVESSITVLEGDYRNNCQYSGNITPNAELDYRDTTEPFITKLSLLYMNTKESYPFADRLVEYISGNAITNLDDITHNVSRIQEILYKDTKFKGFYDIFDDNIKLGIFEKMNQIDKSIKTEAKISGYNCNYPKFFDEYFDLLNYVDKDAESVISR